MPRTLGIGLGITDQRGGGGGLSQAQATLRPSAAGDLTEMIPYPSGTNWEVVSDQDQNTLVYLDEGTGGADLYQMQNLPGDAAAIVQVDVWITAYDFGGTGSTTVQHQLKLGGVTTDGPVHNVTASAQTFTDSAVAKPGGGAWSVADVNALQMGQKTGAVAAGHECDVSDVWLVVTYLH